MLSRLFLDSIQGLKNEINNPCTMDPKYVVDTNITIYKLKTKQLRKWNVKVKIVTPIKIRNMILIYFLFIFKIYTSKYFLILT